MSMSSGMVLDHKRVLKELSALIQKEEDCLIKIYTNQEDIKAKKQPLEDEKNKTGDVFTVLFIGDFNSGKSSVINALLGEELLPTGFLPETAVLGELRYGEKKKIIMYPKKGLWEGGDNPFELKNTTLDEIAKYASLNADDAVNSMETFSDGSTKSIQSNFERMVIYWPLEILKDGVIFVDSPGLGDPYNHDHIANSYLPKTDAVIYIMNATKGYSAEDVKQLKNINTMGLLSIITGYTFWDVVMKQYSKKLKQLENVHNTLIRHMNKHSDLGSESVHFLNSLDGLEAKQTNDRLTYRKSGFEDFENYLGKYLVEGKGTSQVKNMATAILVNATTLIKDAKAFNATAEQDTKILEKKAADAEEQLKLVHNTSLEIGRRYRNQLEGYLPEIETMVREFFKELPEKIDLEGFQPKTELPEGVVNKFIPTKRTEVVKEIEQECQEEIERRVNEIFKEWANETLGEYLKKAVQDTAKAIKPDLEQVARDLNDITDMMTGKVTHSSSTFSNIAVGLVTAMITGDWITGSMSAIYGKGVMAKALGIQLGAGAILGLLMVAGAPVSLPVFVIASLGANIIAVFTQSNEGKVEDIKTQVVKDMRKYYKDPKTADDINVMVEALKKNVMDYFADACNDMNAALTKDIKATEDNIKQMMNEARMSKEEKARQIEARKKAIYDLQALQPKVKEICQKYKIYDLELSNVG